MTYKLRPAEARKVWLEALRSGRYKQGKGRLNFRAETGEETFCCLGVACDLFRQYEEGLPREDSARRKRDKTTGKLGHAGKYGGSCSFLPSRVRTWLGLASKDGRFVPEPGLSRSLAALNDNGKPFTEIADTIEQNLQTLCKKI